MAAVISVSTYFNKRRALATGISFCGSGIGTSALSLASYIFQLLNQRYLDQSMAFIHIFEQQLETVLCFSVHSDVDTGNLWLLLQTTRAEQDSNRRSYKNHKWLLEQTRRLWRRGRSQRGSSRLVDPKLPTLQRQIHVSSSPGHQSTIPINHWIESLSSSNSFTLLWFMFYRKKQHSLNKTSQK